MVDLSARVEPPTLRSLKERQDKTERELDRLRSSIKNADQASSVVVPATVQYDDPNDTFPNGGWFEYGIQLIHRPPGYTRADILLFASAGASFDTTSGGVVGVQPIVGEAGTYSIAGPAISNGVPAASACSVSSFFAVRLIGLTADIYLSTFCNRTGSVIAGSNNIHISAQIVFGR